MKRAFVMPVFAAAIGALLAVGVTALERSAGPSHVIVDLAPRVDVAELRAVEREVRAEVARVREVEREVRVEVAEEIEAALQGRLMLRGELLEKVLQDVESGLLEALASAESLSDEEQEQLREALEQIRSELPQELELAEMLEGITRDDGSAHKDAAAAPKAGSGN